MIKIGDFARFSRVTVRTLRHYEEMGLLRPAQVDRWTGYRYYTFEQLPRLNRILALKDLGLSLEQIAQVLKQDLTPDQLRGMLRLKQAELRQEMQEVQERLARVEARLSQIEKENAMPTNEVILKKVEPQRVAIVRDIVPNMDVIGPTFDRLFDEVAAYGNERGASYAGPAVAVYYDFDEDPDPKMEDMHVGAAIPINGSIPEGERVRVETLPGVETMACSVHHGPFATLSDTYGAVFLWIETNGYRISGPAREVYLQYERGGDQSKYVTEVQFPVEKA